MSSSSRAGVRFDEICRVCAKKASSTMNLFGIRKKGLMLADMLGICTQIQIRQTDFRPSNICGQCLKHLEIAFDFHNLVKTSEDRFERMVAMYNGEAADQSNPIEFSPLGDCSLIEKHMKVEFTEGHNEISPQNTEKRTKKPKNNTIDSFWPTNNDNISEQEIQNRRNNRLYECFICKTKLKSFRDTRNHLKQHNQPTPLKCTVCAMVFSATQLEQHLCKGESIQCDYCAESYRTTQQLLEHLVCHKEQHKLHKCSECPKIYPMIYLLQCHQKQHAQIEKPHVCHICNRGFKVNFLLTKHIATHSDERPHLCSTCGMGFKTMGTLRSHTIRHSGFKPIACTKCPKRFFSKADLKKHMDVHSDAKYICNLCGATLSSKRSLDEHRRHRHRKAEEQACDLCSMKFRTIYNLKRHLLTHTGEKPHKCMYCERAFAQSGDLNKHLRQHVGEKTYQCNLCPKSFRLQIELRKHSYEHFQNENTTDIHS